MSLHEGLMVVVGRGRRGADKPTFFLLFVGLGWRAEGKCVGLACEHGAAEVRDTMHGAEEKT